MALIRRAANGLSEKQVEKELQKLSEWKPNKKHTEISKEYSFPNFVAALAFLAKVTVHAEVMDHHPVAELSYGTLVLTLSTSTVKGLTKKDFELAAKLDRLSR
jgi:4a-hydroxytetrahydrobiopterin dehydratase